MFERITSFFQAVSAVLFHRTDVWVMRQVHEVTYLEYQERFEAAAALCRDLLTANIRSGTRAMVLAMAAHVHFFLRDYDQAKNLAAEAVALSEDGRPWIPGTLGTAACMLALSDIYPGRLHDGGETLRCYAQRCAGHPLLQSTLAEVEYLEGRTDQAVDRLLPFVDEAGKRPIVEVAIPMLTLCRIYADMRNAEGLVPLLPRISAQSLDDPMYPIHAFGIMANGCAVVGNRDRARSARTACLRAARGMGPLAQATAAEYAARGSLILGEYDAVLDYAPYARAQAAHPIDEATLDWVIGEALTGLGRQPEAAAAYGRSLSACSEGIYAARARHRTEASLPPVTLELTVAEPQQLVELSENLAELRPRLLFRERMDVPVRQPMVGTSDRVVVIAAGVTAGHPGTSYVLGLSRDTGRVRWRRPFEHDFGHPPHGIATAADLIIAYGNRRHGGSLSAFRASDGEAVWRVATKYLEAPPFLAGDRVVLPRRNGLLLHDIGTGKLTARYPSNIAMGPVACHGVKAFFQDAAGLVCLDMERQSVAWRRNLPDGVTAPRESLSPVVPLMASDCVVFALRGQLAAHDFGDGAMRWTTPISADVLAMCPVDDDIIVCSRETGAAVAQPSRQPALTASLGCVSMVRYAGATGQLVWRSDVDAVAEDIVGAPAGFSAGAGEVILTLGDRLLRLDAACGEALADGVLAEAVTGGPVHSRDRLFLAMGTVVIGLGAAADDAAAR